MMLSRFFLSVLVCFAPIIAAAESLIVHNRVLATVQSASISVLDIKKQMDFIFFKEFPDQAHSVKARYEFYQEHWQQVLKELLLRELIIQEAEEKKFDVNAGEVRREMEELFGPNVVITLDSIGLSFEDAKKLVRADMLFRRMLYMQVDAKVLNRITPKQIQQAYNTYIQKLGKEKIFVWQALSFKGKDQKTLEAYALHTRSSIEKESIDSIIANAKNSGIICTLSPVFKQHENELETSFREMLEGLQEGSYTTPKTTTQNGDTTVRLYKLIATTRENAPQSAEIEEELREFIAQHEMALEREAYYQRLQHHFNISFEKVLEALPKNFSPFELK